MARGHNIFINHWNTPFYHNHKRSFETGDHLNQALEADEAILNVQPLYNFFNPRFTGYKASYMFWLDKIGVYRGSSSVVKEKFVELAGTEIDKVDKFLKNIYINNQQKYLELMPNGKAPFQKGTYSNKILFSEQLADAMILRVELAPIAQGFKSFTTSVYETRKLQRINNQNVKSASVDLEKKRVILADGLFYVYGGLIVIHFEVPGEIAKYYEVNQMFAKQAGEIIINPDVIVIDLLPLETKEGGFIVDSNEMYNASNVGNSDVEFWITDGTPPNAFTKKGIILAGEECIIKSTDWATSNCRYMYFHDTDNEFNATIHVVKLNPVTT